MKRKSISATALAELGKCEQSFVLALKHEKQHSAQSLRRMEEGSALHARMEREVTPDGRCFIASFAFGPLAPETHALRTYRDTHLTHTLWGRLFVRLYYALSPLLVALLRPIPGSSSLCAWLLRPLVHFLQKRS